MSTLTLLPASYNNSAACTGKPPQKNRIGIGVQAVFSEVSDPLTSPHTGFSVRLRNNGKRKRKAVEIYPDFIRRCILFIDGIREYRVCQTDSHTVEIALSDGSRQQQNAIVRQFENLMA